MPRLKKPIKFQKDWFMNRMKQHGVTQRGAGRIMGLHQSVISHCFAGNRRMPFKEAEIWAKLLKAPFQEILSRAGVPLPDSARNIPTLNTKKVDELAERLKEARKILEEVQNGYDELRFSLIE